MRQKLDKADIRKKTETNAFADFLRRVVPGPASKDSPPPPYSTQNTRRGTQRDVISASVTISEKRVDDDEDENDYEYDENYVEEARKCSRENVGPITSPFVIPYLYKRRFLDTQYGVGKDGDMFMIGDSPIVIDIGGDITIKGRFIRDQRNCGNC